ncbi:MAG: branched-chain amino acid ABC transporter permease [Gemmatimonadales bacterium]
MTDLFQFLIAGVALGAVYALVALGFVVIFRATGVVNFAQGGFVVLGAYLTHQFAVRMGLPFAAGVALAMAVVAGLGFLVERVVLRRMVGHPIFATVLITLGINILVEQVATAIWGYDLLPMGDPWGVRTVTVAGVMIKLIDLWTVAAAAALLGLFFLIFRRSSVGVAMRAAAVDPEAALAHGINPAVIHALSWAIAGAVAAVAGVFLASGPRGVDSTLSPIAFRAFPAMILGGVDSTEGAVAGGLLIGVVEVLSAAYLTPNATALGANIHTVIPYLVMILVLVVRPHGLFGTVEVRRI